MLETSMSAGVMVKLVSVKGTLLGTVTIPGHVATHLHRRGYAQFYMPVPMPTVWDVVQNADFTVRVGTLELLRYGDHPGAVCLHGLTLEEFEQIPGYAFAPGAGYLRSLLAG